MVYVEEGGGAGQPLRLINLFLSVYLVSNFTLWEIFFGCATIKRYSRKTFQKKITILFQLSPTLFFEQ